MTISPRYVRVFHGGMWLIVACACAAFTVWYVGQEKALYASERVNYWNKTISLAYKVSVYPADAVQTLITTIRTEDYNEVPTLFLIPFEIAFGSSRLVFEISIVLTYLLFTFFTCFKLGREMRQTLFQPSIFIDIVVLCNIVLTAYVWKTVLRGYPDVGGASIAALILLLYARNGIDLQSWKKCVYIGLLLLAMILFRRWYLFWVASFLLALVVDAILVIVAKRKEATIRSVIKLCARNIFIVSITCIGLFYLLATPLFERILTTDYSDLYSFIRRTDGPWEEFLLLLQRIGWVQMIVSAAGVAIALFVGGTHRKFFVFAIVQSVICFFYFNRSQSFDNHHYMLFLPTLLLFSGVAIHFALSKIQSAFARYTTGLLLIACFAVMFFPVFVPSLRAQHRELRGWASKEPYYPVVRPDKEEVWRLHTTLEKLTKNDDKIYVLSHSETLTARLMESIHFSFNLPENPISDRYISPATLDKRDGFPQNFFSANYVVVADPIQIAYEPDEQHVITELASALLESKNIGHSYRKLEGTFALDKGVSAYIYERVRKFKKEDIEELESIFREIYPTRPNLNTLKVPTFLLVP